MLPLPQICRSSGYGLLDTAGVLTSSLSACPKKVTKTIVDICKDIGRCATNCKTTQEGGLLINPQKQPESHGSYSSLKESPAAVQGPQGSHYRKQVPQGLFLLMVLIRLARSSPPPRSRPRTMGPSPLPPPPPPPCRPWTGSGSRVGGIRGLGTGPGNIRPTGPAETQGQWDREPDGWWDGNQTVNRMGTRRPTGPGTGPGTRLATGLWTAPATLAAGTRTTREPSETQTADGTGTRWLMGPGTGPRTKQAMGPGTGLGMGSGSPCSRGRDRTRTGRYQDGRREQEVDSRRDRKQMADGMGTRCPTGPGTSQPANRTGGRRLTRWEPDGQRDRERIRDQTGDGERNPLQ